MTLKKTKKPEAQTPQAAAQPKVERPRQEIQVVNVPAKIIEEKRQQSHYLIDALTKAATASGTQIEVVERLWAMHKEAEDRQAEREYGIAKVALAMELPPIPKNHTIEFVDKQNNARRTPYADRGDIEAVLDPLCRKHGFSKEYSTDTDASGRACQVLTVRHVSGHKEIYRSPYMPVDSTGSKNNNQAAGSTSEYGKRYALIGAFNVIGVDKDDDGNLGKDPSEKPQDRFSDRVKADAAKDPKTTVQPPKLTLEEAVQVLESKIRNETDHAKRGEILMKHTSIIKAMTEHSQEMCQKAGELRRLVEGL